MPVFGCVNASARDVLSRGCTEARASEELQAKDSRFRIAGDCGVLRPLVRSPPPLARAVRRQTAGAAS